MTEGKVSVWSRVMPPHGIGFLGTSVFSGTGDPLSEKWEEEWWARFPDRHAQLNTFESALFVLLGSYLYFCPEQLEPTSLIATQGHCPDGLDLAVLLCATAGAPDWVEEILGSVRHPQQSQGGKPWPGCGILHRVWDLCMSMEQQGERLSVYQRLLDECFRLWLSSGFSQEASLTLKIYKAVHVALCFSL